MSDAGELACGHCQHLGELCKVVRLVVLVLALVTFRNVLVVLVVTLGNDFKALVAVLRVLLTLELRVLDFCVEDFSRAKAAFSTSFLK